MSNLAWICPASFWEPIINFWEDKAKDYGPTFSGMLFGFGWWFWMDAVLVNHVSKVEQFIPGIIATLAVLIMNLVTREDVSDYDPFDDDNIRRSRFWLFISYVLSFGAIVGAVWMLLQDYALKQSEVESIWPGVAGVFQVSLVLSSGLVFFLSRGSTDSGGFAFYS